MQIDTDLLIAWGAVAKKYNKNEIIFYEGDQSRFYHQILEGNVKMCSYNDDGKEFIQGVFHNGNSFGEPPLFINERYPACAIADTHCVVMKLSKDSFFNILQEYPDLQKKFLITFAQRIYKKSMTAKNVISQNPVHRIVSFLKQQKNGHGVQNSKVLIPFTRQEIANFTGLRVETVIRTIKKLEVEKIVEIDKRKLYY